MDISGKVIVKAQYEDAGEFSVNGLAAVKKDGKWGWINESGKVVVEPIYEMVSGFDQKVWQWLHLMAFRPGLMKVEQS